MHTLNLRLSNNPKNHTRGESNLYDENLSALITEHFADVLSELNEAELEAEDEDSDE